MPCFVGWLAREKILRGRPRFEFAFEPADLVCRIRWKTERRERCLSRVRRASVVLEARGPASAPIELWHSARIIGLVFGARRTLREWTAEVVVARRIPGERYLSLGSNVNTAESKELDESPRLLAKRTSP